MTLEELDVQIAELQSKRFDLYKEKIAAEKKGAQRNIGRCFVSNAGEYAKIIGTPEESMTKTGIIFNKYQYPSFQILNDFAMPFDFDNFNICMEIGGGKSPFATYREITHEEFVEVFDKRLHDFREKVVNYGKI